MLSRRAVNALVQAQAQTNNEQEGHGEEDPEVLDAARILMSFRDQPAENPVAANARILGEDDEVLADARIQDRQERDEEPEENMELAAARIRWVFKNRAWR